MPLITVSSLRLTTFSWLCLNIFALFTSRLAEVNLFRFLLVLPTCINKVKCKLIRDLLDRLLLEIV